MAHPYKITDRLYLGHSLHSKDKTIIQKYTISHIVNVASNCDNHFPEDFTYYNCYLDDSNNEDIKSHFNETTQFIGN